MSNTNNNQSRSLADWLCYLEQQHHSAIDLGLDRIARVAQRADLHQQSAKVITVAGTNGKGSSCALLEQLLLAKGYQVGVYSSPHLVDFRERVRVNGQLPPAEDFCSSFEHIEQLRGDVSLSFFEFTTLAALDMFRRLPLDYVILEVGLGGRLDATNIVDADVALVTTVALDHVDWLGDDIEQIGREKAGIFREGRPAVIADPEMVGSVAEQAASLHCQTLQAGVHYQFQIDDGHWRYQSAQSSFDKLLLPQLPLMNAAGVLAVLEHLGVVLSLEELNDGLRNWQLAGRLQWLNDQVLVDVAHNPQSAQYLAQRLPALADGRKVHAVVAMLADKDAAATLDAVAPLIEHWHIAGLAMPRGDDGSRLAELLVGQSVTRYSSVADAYRTALQNLQPDHLVLVFGSFFTVAEVIELASTPVGHV
ncbi:bifunctional tetrahydrofolate synthase/dihydrofolate synthase [Aliagarivorans marinus]|uniref:bifunctional tetrahydrofolate synthase/dihydrofolate synthase n=1 Tax=Aliagarivorans marinus TaxID=561965 RepID=UPI000408DA9C|nr:bifunctional tetrahydrofolate synthase/dihydrofolate synthase [Aliagarivorans marinus]